jgi:DNA-directed RNA polymerase specialized sigma24 family protein
VQVAATGLTTLEALYRERYEATVHLARLLVGDPHRAEELAQDAFVRVAPRLADPTAAIDNPAAFLRTVLVNLCRDDGRRRRTADRFPPPPPTVTPAPGLPADLGEIWLAVQALPERRRTAIVLRYWADLATEDIAAVLDVRPATVRSLIHRGLASLEEVLTDDR